MAAAAREPRALVDDWFEAQKRIWDEWLGPPSATAPGDPEDSAAGGDDGAEDLVAALRAAAGASVRAWAETAGSLSEAIADLVAAGAEQAAVLYEQAAGGWADAGAFATPDWDAAAAAFTDRLNDALVGSSSPWARAAPQFRTVSDASWDAWERAARGLFESPTSGRSHEISRALAAVTSAWANFQAAGTEYQVLLAGGWSQAWARFVAVLPERRPTTVRAVLRLWGTTADEVLTELFATEPYAKAQGRLLNTAMAWRLAQRDATDHLLEQYDIPSRRELDEANRAIHDLRREVRRLRREVQDR